MDHGILIIRGDLSIDKHADIIANGYLIITGNIIKGGPNSEGSLTSNDNPVKVFVGGTIPSKLTDHNHQYPTLDCAAPHTTPYPNSNCSYGNMTDIENDPIYSFFQHTCTITNVNSNSPLCTGNTINLTSSGGTGYSWSGPNGFTSNAQNPSIPNANTAMSGAYIVTVTAAAGCMVTDTTHVTVNALPATPTITAGGPATFCAGDSVTLTSSAGTSYLWSTGATTASINVTTAGSYTVQVTNASGCQSATSVATAITVNALPVIPTITAGGPTAFCTGGSVTLTSSAGTGYLWSTGATTPNINVTTAGSYTVQVTNTSGCQSAASVAIIVTVNALPVTPTIAAGGPTTFCAGGSVTLSSSAGTRYLWSNGATTPNINVTTAGSYTVQVTNASGCQSAASAAMVVNVNALPVVNAGTDATIPNGTSTTINATVTGTGPFTYSWTPSAQLVNALIEDPTTVNLATTTVFTLTATSTTTLCSNADAVIITISGGALSSTPTATPGTVCPGANVQLYATASGGSGSYTYTWTSTPPGFTSSIADPIADPTVNTTYNVAVFDGFTTVNSQVAVTVNALPATPTITAGGSTTFCAGGSVTLTSSAGTSYLWSNAETTACINVTTAGSYTVQVTNASGCQSAASAATAVTVNALPATPTITAGGPTTFCAGGSVTLTSSAGSTYLWSTGATTASIDVTTADSYAVKVTNASGCQSAASAATIVVVNALPLVNITSSGNSMCLNDLRTLTGSPTGGTFIIADGPGTITGNILSATGTGNISLKYSYTDVCANKATQSIIVNETPAANAGPDQELKFVFETQMEAELSLSETGEWSLISGSGHMSDIHSPTTRVTELSTGENSFLWKVGNGNCEASAEVKITVYDLFVPSVITPNGDGKNDYFMISEITDQVELIIFNRWGNEEYTNGNYLNDWDGRNNKGMELPNDTYFYILKFENGKIKKGSVLIIR